MHRTLPEEEIINQWIPDGIVQLTDNVQLHQRELLHPG